MPWKSYTSKRYHYKIQYPPTWIVTPGSAGISDQYDAYDYPVLYVSRDTVPSGSIASVRLTISHDIAWYKSHYKTVVVSNKSIKVAGWSGRLLILRGTDNGRTVLIQHLVVAKGRVGYTLNLYGDNNTAGADRALFKRIYGTWRPT